MLGRVGDRARVPRGRYKKTIQVFLLLSGSSLPRILRSAPRPEAPRHPRAIPTLVRGGLEPLAMVQL